VTALPPPAGVKTAAIDCVAYEMYCARRLAAAMLGLLGMTILSVALAVPLGAAVLGSAVVLAGTTWEPLAPEHHARARVSARIARTREPAKSGTDWSFS
jgi:hypothetical protein